MREFILVPIAKDGATDMVNGLRIYYDKFPPKSIIEHLISIHQLGGAIVKELTDV